MKIIILSSVRIKQDVSQNRKYIKLLNGKLPMPQVLIETLLQQSRIVAEKKEAEI